MHEGSLITAIGGAKVTSHFHSDEISEMIRGEEGTRLSIEVVPPDPSGRHNRAKIQFVDLVLGPRTLFFRCRARRVPSLRPPLAPLLTLRACRNRCACASSTGERLRATAMPCHVRSSNKGIPMGTHMFTPPILRGALILPRRLRVRVWASPKCTRRHTFHPPPSLFSRIACGAPRAQAQSRPRIHGKVGGQRPAKAPTSCRSSSSPSANSKRTSTEKSTGFSALPSPSNFYSLATALPRSLPYFSPSPACVSLPYQPSASRSSGLGSLLPEP